MTFTLTVCYKASMNLLLILYTGITISGNANIVMAYTLKQMY